MNLLKQGKAFNSKTVVEVIIAIIMMQLFTTDQSTLQQF